LIKIRKEQYDALVSDAFNHVVVAVASYLQTDHQQLVGELPGIRFVEFVRESVKTCGQLGFSTARGICELLDFLLEWGDFSGPDSERILRVLRSERSEEYKLQELRRVWILTDIE
jgi:hypothetical protein